ncbi:hypothetical protein DVH24_021075 [Malus domestica]|uniref:DUF1985 domain-containing protein n=1 Tax=Malus domestica TaxID=3750 RepID=A0A498JE95_MALDO|nr:hypothetical protein DVH24_021075 [Malus domestica]
MTVDWASLVDVCAKMVGLVGESATEECENIKGSYDDNEVMINTLDGQHVRTKRNVSCTRATSKSIQMKMSLVAQFKFMIVGDTDFWRKHKDKAQRIRKVVTTNTTDWFLSYCQRSYNERNAKIKSRERKGVACKPYEPLLYKTVTGNGVEFNASWDDHPHAASEYKIGSHRSCPVRSLVSLSRDVKKGPWPIDVSPRSPQQDNEIVAQGVQLATKEEESYRGRVKNLSHASHMLSVMESCFGHLDSVDRLTFSGQLIHELSLHRVSNQGVKDLEGLTYLISCEVMWFTKDFCLITRLHCDKPYDMEVEPSNIKLLTKYFPHRFGFVGESSKGKGSSSQRKVGKRFWSLFTELEKAFQECKNEDSAFKLELLYFVKGVLIGVKSNVAINLEYFELVNDMDKFNSYSRGAISFKQLQDNLSFAASRRRRGRVEGDVKEDDEEEEEEGRGTYKIIPQLEKPLRYCKMTDPAAILRILQWATTKKQPVHERLQIYIIESRKMVKGEGSHFLHHGWWMWRSSTCPSTLITIGYR